MSAHLRKHAINTSDDHLPGTNGTLLGTESGAIAEKAFGTSANGGVIVQRLSGGDAGQIAVPVTPLAAAHAASKAYVDSKVVEGVTWKELVLVVEQLKDGASGAILQAILCAIATNSDLAANDLFKISDGTTTETYTFKATRTGPFEVAIGGSEDATTTNLVNAINTDSVVWSAVKSTGLDVHFAAGTDPQFVIYRKTNTAVTNDRVFGTIAAGQSAIKVVEFQTTGIGDYTTIAGVESSLPGTDPAAKRFGFGRAYAGLIQGETHRISNDSTAYTWDGDDQVWQQSSAGGSMTAGDGIDITANKVTSKVSIPTGSSTQQFGGLTNRRDSDGTGTAAADQGYLAVKTDNSDLAVDQATNAIKIKPLSRLDRFKGAQPWSSTSASDKEPTLAELQNALGTTANDVGNWCFMVEDQGTNIISTFIAYKKGNVGALSDYHLVEMT